MDDALEVIACTGHRPGRFGGYSSQAFNKLLRFAIEVLSELPDHKRYAGISGMALGWDMAFAGACVELGIPFVAFVPFEGQENAWKEEYRTVYNNLVSKASKVAVCSPGGMSKRKYQVRNEKLVDNCNTLLALWDGSWGGTRNTLAYASKVGRYYANLWNRWERFE